MKEKLYINKSASVFLIFRNWLINNIILLLILPLSVIFIIFITYGDLIEKVLIKNPELFKLFQLKTQLIVLTYNTEIPIHVKSLGYDSVILLIIIFFMWLLTHTLYCYLQLSHKSDSKALLLFETVLLFLIFIFIVSPNLPLAIIVLGYLALIAQIILIAIYWVFSLKQKE